MKTTVWITTQFRAFHRWKDAQDNVVFLRDYHRHVFHVKLGMKVSHDNREIEFFNFQKNADLYIFDHFMDALLELSCEQIAIELLKEFSGSFCEVSEDGENGALVEE